MRELRLRILLVGYPEQITDDFSGSLTTTFLSLILLTYILIWTWARARTWARSRARTRAWTRAWASWWSLKFNFRLRWRLFFSCYFRFNYRRTFSDRYFIFLLCVFSFGGCLSFSIIVRMSYDLVRVNAMFKVNTNFDIKYLVVIVLFPCLLYSVGSRLLIVSMGCASASFTRTCLSKWAMNLRCREITSTVGAKKAGFFNWSTDAVLTWLSHRNRNDLLEIMAKWIRAKEADLSRLWLCPPLPQERSRWQ